MISFNNIFNIFRALNFNTLVGNIGGYVGLLVGVSITQIPDIILHIYQSSNDFYNNRKKRQLKDEEDEKNDFASVKNRSDSSTVAIKEFGTVYEIITIPAIQKSK